MRKMRYTLKMNSSLGGLLEKLNDLGAYWTMTGLKNDWIGLEVSAAEGRFAEIEEEIAFYM